MNRRRSERKRCRSTKYDLSQTELSKNRSRSAPASSKKNKPDPSLTLESIRRLALSPSDIDLFLPRKRSKKGTNKSESDQLNEASRRNMICETLQIGKG